MTARGRKRVLLAVALVAFLIEGGRQAYRAFFGEGVRFLEVVDEHGLPIGTAMLEGGIEGVGREKNLLRVPEGTGDRPLTVYARGYRTRTAVARDTRTPVVLRRGIEIRLRLPAGVAFPDPPRRLVVSLEGVRGPPDPWYSGVGKADATDPWERDTRWNSALYFQPPDRTLRLLVHAPGPYHITWRIATVEREGTNRETVEGAPPADAGTIEVRDTGAVQEFELSLDR